MKSQTNIPQHYFGAELGQSTQQYDISFGREFFRVNNTDERKILIFETRGASS